MALPAFYTPPKNDQELEKRKALASMVKGMATADPQFKNLYSPEDLKAEGQDLAAMGAKIGVSRNQLTNLYNQYKAEAAKRLSTTPESGGTPKGTAGSPPMGNTTRDYIPAEPTPPKNPPKVTPSVNSMPTAPLQGRALAQQNLRTMGVQGAAADYFRRAEAEKAAAQERRDTRISRGIAGKQVVQPPLMTQPVEPRGSFAAKFGIEANRDEPSPAMRQARANTIAAREKADTMREEYERGKVESDYSDVLTERSNRLDNIMAALMAQGKSYTDALDEGLQLQTINSMMKVSRGQVDPRLVAINPDVYGTSERHRAFAREYAEKLRKELQELRNR